MSKSLFFLSAALVAAAFISQPAHAKIWRVNNTGIQADFTTVQAAHDAAAVQPGDTLHLEPSPTSYGNLINMSKRLTIISIGAFLADNPGRQFSPSGATMGDLSFASNATASKSVFHCNMEDVNLYYADSVRIEGCYIRAGNNLALHISNNSDNNIVIGNYIYSIGVSESKNDLIANNIIMYEINTAETSSTTIINNVIQATLNPSNSAGINNAVFRNNIINKTRPVVFFNCVVENNVFSSTSPFAGNGNQNNVIMTNVFVNPNGTADNAFVLQAAGANPAKGAGVGGADCGAFGGSSPYKLALQPAIPAIYQLVVPPTASGNTMNISLSTRSNN